MRKRFLSLLLTLALVMAAVPFISDGANAATVSGSTKLLKTKTVTIKPGKTYKSPKIKTTEGHAFVMPIQIWLSSKDKKKPKNYIKKGSLKVTIKDSGKLAEGTVTTNLKGIGKRSSCFYDGWFWYYYGDDASVPQYPAGTYWFQMKNTTSRTIQVKYSVLGCQEFAGTADFGEELLLDETKDLNYDNDSYYIGQIGPGVPAIESIDLTGDDADLIELYGWWVTLDGKLYVRLYPDGSKPLNATLSVKLANREAPFDMHLTLIPEAYYDDFDDDWDDDSWNDDDE